MTRQRTTEATSNAREARIRELEAELAAVKKGREAIDVERRWAEKQVFDLTAELTRSLNALEINRVTFERVLSSEQARAEKAEAELRDYKVTLAVARKMRDEAEARVAELEKERAVLLRDKLTRHDKKIAFAILNEAERERDETRRRLENKHDEVERLKARVAELEDALKACIDETPAMWAREKEEC